MTGHLSRLPSSQSLNLTTCVDASPHLVLDFSVQIASPSRLEQSLFRTLMPRTRQAQHPADCDCCAQPTPAGQSIEELDFLRSACTLAQAGNQPRLAAFIEAHPASVNEDGCGGGLRTRLMQAMLMTSKNVFENGAVHISPATCCCAICTMPDLLLRQQQWAAGYSQASAERDAIVLRRGERLHPFALRRACRAHRMRAAAVAERCANTVRQAALFAEACQLRGVAAEFNQGKKFHDAVQVAM